MAGTGIDHERVIRDQIQRRYQEGVDAEERATKERIRQLRDELEKRGMWRSSIADGALIGIVRDEGLRLVARRLEITKEVLHEAGKEPDLERMALVETDVQDLVDNWANRRVPYLAKWVVSLGGWMSAQAGERAAAGVRLRAKQNVVVMRGEARLAAIRNESRPHEEAPAGNKAQRSSRRERATDNTVALFLAGLALTFLGLAIIPLCGGEGGPVAAVICLAIAGVFGVVFSAWSGAVGGRKRRRAAIGGAWVAFLVVFGWGISRITAAARAHEEKPDSRQAQAAPTAAGSAALAGTDFAVSLEEAMPVSVAGYPYGCVLVVGSISNRGAEGQARGIGVSARLADGREVGSRPQEQPKRLTVRFPDGTVAYFREDALKRFELSPVGRGETVYGVMFCYFPGVAPEELSDARTSYWLAVRDEHKRATSTLFPASKMPDSIAEVRHLPGVRMEVTSKRTGKTVVLE